MKLIIKERPGPWFLGLWHSFMCVCMPDGHIVKYIKSLKSENTVAIPWSDGFRFIDEKNNNISEFEGYDEDVIIATQASLILSYNHRINKIICIPLDDETFEIGLRSVLLKHVPVSILDMSWEDKKPTAFWRGAGPHPLRQKVIEELFDYKHADVLYSRISGNKEEDYTQKWWDQTYGSAWRPIGISEFVKHKYILVIDNFIITSSYQWVFGSGSVPIFITHPLDDFWFKEFLIPWVNYVPAVHPDFGILNIRNIINYLRDHDDVAKKIAENARDMANMVFSPQFQREYIKIKFNATE